MRPVPMESKPKTPQDLDLDQARLKRRNTALAIILGLVALGIYIGFILAYAR